MRRAYRGRTFNRESVYVCGDYMDGSIYPVYQQAGKRRKKCRPTSAIQQRLNQRNAERKLARIVHNNFTGDDMALHLTYRPGEEPETEEAKRILANYIRRLKRLYRKLGLELRYISCTEYGRTNGRVHHHLIISGGADRDTIEQLWGRGYANSKRLQFTEEGVVGLAHYMVKDRHFYRRWNQSRNLTMPECAQYDGRLDMEDIADLAEAIECGTQWQWFEERYPDFELVEATAYKNNINQGMYINFAMCRRGRYLSLSLADARQLPHQREP